MKISVRNHTGKTINLWVENSDTIKLIKTKIQVKSSIPLGQQELTYDNKDLENDLTLSDCQIEEEAILRCEFHFSF